MKRTVPLLITAVSGIMLIVSTFVPAIQEWGKEALVWFDILASIAFILGGGNLLALHLKAMSDRKAGWGYSLVTLVAFIVTLVLGLAKVGSPPAFSVENYGTTAVRFPLSQMPVYRVPGKIPTTSVASALPKDVRSQLKEVDGELLFQGWMTATQRTDLLEFSRKLDWQCQVEELYAATQQAELEGRVGYDVKRQAIMVSGVLDEELKNRLTSVLGESAEAKQAIDQLHQKTHETTVAALPFVPKSLSIPDSADGFASLEGSELTIVGPLSPAMRDQIANSWAGFPPAMPLSPEQQKELQSDLEQLGSPLNELQLAAWSKFFATEWEAGSLIEAINLAGIVAAPEKSACELFAEQQSGVKDLVTTLPAPPETQLNDDQKQAIQVFVEQPGQTPDQLKESVAGLGEFTAAQSGAVDSFLAGLPREADRLKALGLTLIKEGELSQEQQEFLFAGAKDQYAWKVAIDQLFLASNSVKNPWSGGYSTEGIPFWWVYEYVLQPLMTTTFAMLAFYVASAAFRAFRAKNLEAGLLLGTAFIVLLGRTALGVELTAWVPDALSALKIDQMTVYIMKIFNTAGNRAIMIGIALGIASTSLKVLLGIDRSYLGAGDD